VEKTKERREEGEREKEIRRKEAGCSQS